jgi:hypothetical protein
VNYQSAVPAYGRDYPSKAKLLVDWQAGRDFRLEPQGQLFSIRDAAALRAAGTIVLNIRYRGLREICIIKL